jgi:hypothetical protein
MGGNTMQPGGPHSGRVARPPVFYMSSRISTPVSWNKAFVEMNSLEFEYAELSYSVDRNHALITFHREAYILKKYNNTVKNRGHIIHMGIQRFRMVTSSEK